MKVMTKKMGANVKYLCAEKKRKSLVDNQNCMSTENVRTGMERCQALVTLPASCAVYKDVVDCTDQLLNRECPDIHHTLSHVLRSYVGDVLKLNNCPNVGTHDTISGHNHEHEDDDDHDHDHGHDKLKNDASMMQMPMLIILANIIVAKLIAVVTW
jgi:hypothetical protein